MKYKNLLYLLGIIILECNSYDPRKNSILCIVNFNFPHYENIQIIQKLYENFFPNMVFYGPGQHPEIHSIEHRGYIGSHPTLPEYIEGYFGYKEIADAMKRYPDYEGYLWINDDCFINVFNFERLNTSKIWVTPLKFTQKSDTDQFWFWKIPGGWDGKQNVITIF